MHAEIDASGDLDGARYVDLVAKIAKLRLKDVRRVLLAMDALREAFSITSRPLVSHAPHLPTRTEIAACERVYHDFMRRAKEMPQVDELLREIQNLKRTCSRPHPELPLKRSASAWSIQ